MQTPRPAPGRPRADGAINTTGTTMARVIAPLMSQDASGKVGSVVHAKWKGRNYVRGLVTPSNPKSPKQTSHRGMHRFLSQAWATIGATPQATWDATAKTNQVSPFNEFMRDNKKRWVQFKYPSVNSPAGESDTAGTIGVATATAGVKQVTITIPITTLANNWGVAIFRSTTTGFTKGVDNLVAAIPAKTAATFTFVDTALATGTTYYYLAVPFSMDGKAGTVTSQLSATPT